MIPIFFRQSYILGSSENKKLILNNCWQKKFQILFNANGIFKIIIEYIS